jgi:inner membrane protein
VCWSFVSVASNEAGGSYHLRRGLLSIAPGIAPVASCPAPIAGQAEAQTQASAGLSWLSDERHSLAALRALRHSDCRFDAWLRFARAPSLGDGSATDVRWGPPGSLNFSTIDLAAMATRPCPHPVPGWGMPREDLLGGR